MEAAVPFHHFEEAVSYETFELYLQSNTPCTFGSWISQDWPARQTWVSKEGSPNLDYLDENFGCCKASVTEFNERLETDCNEQTISQFISYWNNVKSSRFDKMTDTFPTDNFPSLPHYLKDWHFAKNTPPKSVYQVPDLFSDDWLNRYWKTREDVNDDYIFAYFGPAGSYTPFHADVFRSYSWSVNVCGAKKWLILYPGEELKLDSLSRLNVEQQCSEKNVKYVIVTQGPGQGIFVPSGWWHQVLNTADTISINHNWANFHCVPRMWCYLTSELELVEKEISDCRDLMNDQEWFEQCQLVLRANIGLDFSEFLDFVLANLYYLSQPNHDVLIRELSINSSWDKCENVMKSFSQLYSVNEITDFVRKHRIRFGR